jgi:hypothetical protein
MTRFARRPAAGLLPIPPSSAPACALERTLASYLLNRHRGAAAVRDILVADIAGYVDLGQTRIAGDLVAVLGLLLRDWPEARLDRPPFAWGALLNAVPGSPEPQ